MENAAEALKIAGFTLLFVTALSVAMITVMQGKSTSETIISYSDKTKYYSNIEVTSSEDGNRKVSVYDIIPTLYRYKQEEYIVLFEKNGQPLQIYNGETNINKNDYLKKISYLNYNLEDKMQEKWRTNDTTVKKHVDEVVQYLVNNYDTAKFIETISTTTDKYRNNAGVPESEQIEDEIRVITYTLQ